MGANFLTEPYTKTSYIGGNMPEQSLSLIGIPVDLLQYILTFLSAYELIRLESVSKLTSERASSEKVWKIVLQKEEYWQPLLQQERQLSYRQFYKESTLILNIYKSEYPQAITSVPTLQELHTALKEKIKPAIPKPKTFKWSFSSINKVESLPDPINELARLCLEGTQVEIANFVEQNREITSNLDFEFFSLLLSITLHNPNSKVFYALIIALEKAGIDLKTYYNKSLESPTKHYLFLEFQKQFPSIKDKIDFKKFTPQAAKFLTAVAPGFFFKIMDNVTWYPNDFIPYFVSLIKRYPDVFTYDNDKLMFYILCKCSENVFIKLENSIGREVFLNWRSQEAGQNILHVVSSEKSTHSPVSLTKHIATNYPALLQLKDINGRPPIFLAVIAYVKNTDNPSSLNKNYLLNERSKALMVGKAALNIVDAEGNTLVKYAIKNYLPINFIKRLFSEGDVKLTEEEFREIRQQVKENNPPFYTQLKPVLNEYYPQFTKAEIEKKYQKLQEKYDKLSAFFKSSDHYSNIQASNRQTQDASTQTEEIEEISKNL